jgi:cell wall-associated NlpC family hydrolase
VPSVADGWLTLRVDDRQVSKDVERGVKNADTGSAGRAAASRFTTGFNKEAKRNPVEVGGLGALAAELTGLSHAQTIGSRKAGLLAKAFAGVNLATGILEPAMAGLIVSTAGYAASLSVAAAGLGVYGLAMMGVGAQYKEQVKLQAAVAAGTKGAQKALDQFMAGTTSSYRAWAASIETAKSAFDSWSTGLQGAVLAPQTQAIGLASRALHAIRPLAVAASKAIGILVNELSAKIGEGGLERVVAVLLPHVIPSIVALGHVLANIAAGLWGVMKAFLPVSDTIASGVVRLTARFKEWGNSLPKHSGFQALMNMYKNQAPLAAQVLKNLATIIGNVARATIGLASPANSKALLQILIPLTAVVVQLTKNQALVRWVLYALMLNSALKKVHMGFVGLKAGLSGLAGGGAILLHMAQGFMSVNAAQSASTGMAGTLGGRLRSLWQWFSKTAVATRIATAVQWLWNAALAANPIGIIIIALVALGVAFVVLWTRSATFRKICIGAFNAVLGAAKAAWKWIKGNWPLLLGILGGPVGLAAVVIIKHWGDIRRGLNAAIGVMHRAWSGFVNFLSGRIGWLHGIWSTFCNAIHRAWSGTTGAITRAATNAWNAIKAGIRVVWNVISGVFGAIINGAARAFGWVPGLGGKLKGAARAFNTFRNNVNAALGEVRDRKVKFKVSFSNAPVPIGVLRARGGPVDGPGTPTSDSIPAMLSRREWVIKARSADHYGPAAMRAVNEGRAAIGYAGGGWVNPGVTVQPQTPSAATINAGAQANIVALAKLFASSLLGGGMAIVTDAMRWLGKIPYVWGGSSVPGGADCSGFVQTIYGRHGIHAPRTSESQGAWVKRSAPVPGGLAFYHSPGGGYDPGHVAIVRNAGQVISQGGGMGPRLMALRGMPLLWTGVPPGGFGGHGGAPAGGTFGESQLDSLWRSAGGPARVAHMAAAIAMAESGGRAWIVNSIGAEGLWQIFGHPFPGNALDPFTNARMAVAKYRDARGFGPWEAYTNGSYRRFMAAGGPVGSYDNGGRITEPILGLGQRSGRRYSFAKGEAVQPRPDQTERLLERLIRAVEDNAERTAGGLAAALDGAAGRAAYRAKYSVR